MISLESIIRYIIIIISAWIMYHIHRLLLFIFELRKYGKAVDNFPMPPKHWIWGHMKMLTGQDEEGLNFFLSMMRKHPKAFGMYIGNFIRPYVVVYDPEIIKMVLLNSAKKPTMLGMYGYGKYWIGNGLALANGKKWFRNRKLITPAFHFDYLKKYSSTINQSAEKFLTNLSDLSDTGEAFEAQTTLSYLTLDVILKCAFSYDSDLLVQIKSHFYPKVVDEIAFLWMKRYFEPWKHFDFIYWRTEDGKKFKNLADKVNLISEKLIQERKKLIEKDLECAKKYDDFLNIILVAKDEDGVGLTDRELRDEVNTFIFAGYETTAASLSWILYSLATHPEYQKRCQKEADDLFEGRSDEYIGWDDLKKLKYITTCIKESLRLYGGAPFIERELENDVLIDGREVPAGTSVMINLFCLHHNPKVWKDPLVYNPERFADDNMIDMNSFAFLPFAASSRNCIGQSFAMEEMKIVVAKILRRFKLTAMENHVPVKIMALTMKSRNGLFLRVRKR